MAVLGTAFALLGSPPPLGAEVPIINNRETKGDFNGLDRPQEWIVNLTNDFNTLRFEVESPTAKLSALLQAPNGKYITLFPAGGKGVRCAGWAVCGSLIEAAPDNATKLAPGRYVIRVAPQAREFAGAYTIKILEPSLGRQEQPSTSSTRPPSSRQIEEIEKQLEELKRQVSRIEQQLQELKRDQQAK